MGSTLSSTDGDVLTGYTRRSGFIRHRGGGRWDLRRAIVIKRGARQRSSQVIQSKGGERGSSGHVVWHLVSWRFIDIHIGCASASAALSGLRLKFSQALSRALELFHCQDGGYHVISSLPVGSDGRDFHHPSNGPLSHRYGGAVWLCRCCVGVAVKLQHVVVDSGSP